MASNQAYLFLIFTINGILIGFLFDIFRILRKSFKTNDLITYIEDIFSVRDINSQIKKDITVTEKDKIITLSTCMNDKEKRFLVSGVLVYDSDLD